MVEFTSAPDAPRRGASSFLEGLLRRLGVGWAAVAIGAVSVCASAALYSVITLVLRVGTYQHVGLLRAVMISAVVAPPIAYAAMRMAERLEHARRTLEASEGKYRTLLETLAYGCCETDLALAITFANEPLAALAGLPAAALPGRRIDELVAPVSAGGLEGALRRVRDEGAARVTLRLVVRPAGGEDRTVEGTVSLLRDGGGRPRGYRGIFRDITEEVELARRSAELEERVHQAQKMEALGILAGGIAHDLNNILSGVVAYPEIIAMGLPPDSPLREDLAAIHQSGVKAAGIVEDLLTMARRSPARREAFSLGELVEDYLASPEHGRLLDTHPGVRLETAVAAGLPPIEGSRLHLHKSLMNLVANAAEAIRGEGVVRISLGPLDVGEGQTGPAGAGPGRHVVLRVSDDGEGIRAADLPRVFEPFFTRKVLGRSGTGLGLAIVWGTVRDHGGQIGVESAEGRGTTFTVVLPAGAAVPEAAPAPVGLRWGAGEWVLVVDDSAEQRRLAAKLLDALGYRVTAVSSGEEAVALFRDARNGDDLPDVLLLDVLMEPGIDGVEALRRIRELHPVQRAVFTSGYSENRLAEDGLGVGGVAFLRKPYRLEELGASLRGELERVPD